MFAPVAKELLCGFLDVNAFRLDWSGPRASSSGAGGTARRSSKKHTLEDKKTFIMNREFERLTIPDFKQLIECFGLKHFAGISATTPSKDKTLLKSFYETQSVAKEIGSDWGALKGDYIDLIRYIDGIYPSKIDRASEIFGNCEPKRK